LLACDGGLLTYGREAIRKFYGELVATGRKFELGEQRAAMVCGDLALTSTRLRDGTVTAEIARRQSDGTWLWVIDQFSISSEATSHALGDRPRVDLPVLGVPKTPSKHHL
jgi:hypothetical protein